MTLSELTRKCRNWHIMAMERTFPSVHNRERTPEGVRSLRDVATPGKSILVMLFLICLSSVPATAAPAFVQVGNVLVMSNANVRLEYNLAAGTTDFYWQNAKKISGFYSGVTLSSGYLRGINFSNRTWSVVSSNQVVVSANAGGLPGMHQYFTLDQSNSFLTRVEMTGVGLSANWMGPLVMDTAGGVDLGSYNDPRALFVPFDNDHSVRYNAESLNGSDTGHEVGAFYDNTTRNGLVVGSVTHDAWKTGVFWSGSNNKLDQLNVFGGVTSRWTWDVMPHGAITGNTISSPTIFVGFGADWRTLLEAFADENAAFTPRRSWSDGVPFGWNSWGYYQSKLTYASAIGVSDSIHTNLQPYGFTNGGTVYINLDSYWNNLWTDYGGSQLQSFVDHCHANGQKAGIYFTPFAFWGNANDATNYWVPVGFPPDYTQYRFSDILITDGNGNFIGNDGGLAIDPTHPGTQGYIDYYVYWFTTWGFDYVKLDFLSHGALEGSHYDPSVTTGIQALNQGMRYLLNALGGSMFVSESISPIFPYQFGHSRRIACDAQNSRISDTEYTMNSVSYGWWLNRLYAFNDPDIMDFATGANSNENQSRVINGAITGLFLNGDSLTNATSINAARTMLTNAAINEVARAGQTFRLVEGNTGSSASDQFLRQDGTNWRVAVFNYSASATNKTVDLVRAGLPPGTYTATDLWSGTTSVVSGTSSVALSAKQAKLFTLAAMIAPPTITTQPVSFTNAIPMYSGVPITLSVVVGGSQPLSYQWYQIVGGVTNLVVGATNSSFTHLAQSGDTNTPLLFLVVVRNNYGSATSSVAVISLNRVVTGTPEAVSVQFTLTNYSGYASGLFLAPNESAGVYAVSNWNVFAITPAGGNTGTQPGVTLANLTDRTGIMSPTAVRIVNVSDGWHQTVQTITGADTANARMMNTFWKTHNNSSPATNLLYTTFTNLPNGTYTAYVYLLQNNSGATGCVSSVNGSTNYFQEFTAFNSLSNFVTALDATGAVNPSANYLRLTGLSTGGTNTITITTAWLGGTDGIGVCGVQLVPPIVLTVGPRTNGQFGFQFRAPDSQKYVVEMSTNLSAWLPVSTNSPTNGLCVFVSTNATDLRQFYRVRQ
jgi:hypothetical protein